jgi:hypothetical protein
MSEEEKVSGFDILRESQRDRWEYSRLLSDDTIDINKLNDLGPQGWELVASFYSGGKLAHYLKRKLA